MIEQVINRRNMRLAYQHVLKNKGSAGVDGMQVNELTVFVKQNRDQIASALYKGRYKVQPILGVSIPKSNGKTRLLGIPTVVDRWLQQCVDTLHECTRVLVARPGVHFFRDGNHNCVS